MARMAARGTPRGGNRPMQIPGGRLPDVFRYTASKSVFDMAVIRSVASEEFKIEVS